MTDEKRVSEQALAETIARAHRDYLESLRAGKRLPRAFLDGIVRGFGMAIGGTIVFGIVIYLLGQLIVPSAERWIEERIDQLPTQAAGFSG